MKVELAEAGVLPEGWRIQIEPVVAYRPTEKHLVVRLIDPNGDVQSEAGMQIRATSKPLTQRDGPNDVSTYRIGPFWTNN